MDLQKKPQLKLTNKFISKFREWQGQYTKPNFISINQEWTIQNKINNSINKLVTVASKKDKILRNKFN